MMTRRTIALAITLLVGCGASDSIQLDPRMTAQVNGTRFALQVTLFDLADEPQSFVLGTDDQLVATLRGESHALEHGAINTVVVDLGTPVVEEELLVVSLHRNGGGAFTAQVMIPVSPVVTAGSPASLSHEIMFTWAPSGTDAAVAWSIEAPCAAGYGPVRGDPGALAIPANALTVATGSCRGTVAVGKGRRGTVDSDLGLGALLVDVGESTEVDFVP